MVKTRNKNRRRVLTWFASWWRNHRPKQAEKPHSKSSGRKALDGPATRPKTPLAVENGVGKLTAPERGAPNVGMGKRAWRTPSPHLSLLDRKAGQGLIVFTDGETFNIEHRTPNIQLKNSRQAVLHWMFQSVSARKPQGKRADLSR
jgi:hypothetical protein